MTSMLTVKDLDMNVQVGPSSRMSLLARLPLGRTGLNARGAKLLVPPLLGLAGKEPPPLVGSGLKVNTSRTGQAIHGGDQGSFHKDFVTTPEGRQPQSYVSRSWTWASVLLLGTTGLNAREAKLLVPPLLGLAGNEPPPLDGIGLKVKTIRTGHAFRDGDRGSLHKAFDTTPYGRQPQSFVSCSWTLASVAISLVHCLGPVGLGRAASAALPSARFLLCWRFCFDCVT